jgi:uncharacterized protein (DUF302 family)
MSPAQRATSSDAVDERSREQKCEGLHPIRRANPKPRRRSKKMKRPARRKLLRGRWDGGIMAVHGLITLRSNFGPAETASRLENELTARGLTIFARVDHAAGAEAVGMALRPTELFVFGNARGGTPLMQAEQTTGIDLPLKALVWQDAADDTFLSYNEPSWLAQRHGLAQAADAAVTAMTAALKVIAVAATSAS